MCVNISSDVETDGRKLLCHSLLGYRLGPNFCQTVVHVEEAGTMMIHTCWNE